MQELVGIFPLACGDRLSDISYPMDQDRLRTRVRRRLKELGRSAVQAAEIGASRASKREAIGRDYLRDWLEDRKGSLKQSKLWQVAAGLDWSVEQLLGNAEKAPSQITATAHSDENKSADWAVIPEQDVRAGLSYGGGFSQDETVIDEHGRAVTVDAVRQRWGVPVPFLRDELGIRPGRVHILPVRGDSMTDTLFDGDRVMLDLDDIDVSQGGIFALRDDNGSIIVKQVELVRSGKGEPPRIRCKSRNPHYEPFDLVLEEPVAILGRVACRITRL